LNQSTRAALDALSKLVTPRRALADALDELETRRRSWSEDLCTTLGLLDGEERRFTFADGRTSSSLPDELDDEIAAFVDGAEPDLAVIPTHATGLFPDTGEIHEWDVQDELAKCRPEIDADLADAARGIAKHKQHLDEAFGPVRDRLSDWLDDVATQSGATAGDWGRIQKAWRTTLTLPMRVAGELLDVSSAAVARYETGSRTPSLPALRTLVSRVIEAGPTPGLELTRAIAAVSRSFGQEVSLDYLDADPVPALLASIEDRLGALTVAQLRFIDTVIVDSSTLDQFIVWTATAPTALLRAVADLRTAP
jgi:transcriptional regulator with XRE-family HTH domain